MNAELVERLEKATGPDRDLDWQSHCDNGSDGTGMYGAHPFYTSSIDAALTLVPDGFVWLVRKGYSHGEVYYAAAVFKEGVYEEHLCVGATPALALCIAALKARGNK